MLYYAQKELLFCRKSRNAGGAKIIMEVLLLSLRD